LTFELFRKVYRERIRTGIFTDDRAELGFGCNAADGDKTSTLFRPPSAMRWSVDCTFSRSAGPDDAMRMGRLRGIADQETSRKLKTKSSG
jgi:hypothetical protein